MTRPGTRLTGPQLLDEAAALYDAPVSPLRDAAAHAWKTVFQSGADWMALALSALRGHAVALPARPFNIYGMLKNGGSALVMLGIAAILCAARLWWLLPFTPFVFYAVEGQMVFLFPLLIDRIEHPFRAGRRMVVQAGGTLEIMRVVMVISLTMIFGGLLGRGFIRSWCLGCIAVVLWYEKLRLGAIREEPIRVSANS